MKSKIFVLLGVLTTILLFVSFQKSEPGTAPSPEVSIETTSAVEPSELQASTVAATPLAATAIAPVERSAPSPNRPVESVPELIAPSLTVELAQIPASTLRTQLSSLNALARQKALQKIEELQVPAQDMQSLRVTPDGKLYYFHDIPPPAEALGASLANLGPTAARAAPVRAAAAVPIANQPIHHSKPGATNIIYLDFNGHTITGTSWNTGTGSQTTYVGKPFDTDGDSTTFSDAEQAIITEVWQRVAEDYAPFDVDVTTEEPATFTNTTCRAMITPKLDANGVAMPSSTGGGVAYTGVFGDSDYATASSPAFTYSDNLGNTADSIADATSHEVGHNMGLTHDGQGSEEYYGGHGTGDTSWGPIMGAPYDQNLSQWSKGEYLNATNTANDDLAILNGKLSAKTDEAGGTIQTAAAATTNGASVSNTGVLASGTDLDVFSFSTASGNLSFSASTYRAATGTHGGNADLKLELLDGAGSVVATHDPTGTTNASLNYTATAGTYYVRISPAAEGTPTANPATGYTTYGSTGQYTLTGTIVAASPAITSATTSSIGAGASYSYTIVGTNAPTSYAATGLPNGLTVNTTTGVITGRSTATGVFNITLSATNSLGTGNGALALTVTDAAPVITAQSSGRITVVPGAAQSLSVTALSANGTPTYEWHRNGRAITGATSATFDLSTMGPADSGYYRVRVTNTIGTTVGGIVFVLYAPTASEVVGWGKNTSGQTTIPTGLTTAIAVATGSTHSLALKSDGTVVAWGSSNSGETTVPTNLTDVVKIAAGSDSSFALKSDGTVVAWGSSGFTHTIVPSGLTDVVDITTAGSSALALKSDGTLVSWGTNGSGQLTLPANIGTVLALDAGLSSTTFAINSAGTLFGFGSNPNGETTVPAASLLWRDVSGGGYHAIGLKSDGTVEGWGFDGAPPGGLTNAIAISAGEEHSLALKSDGTITAWGGNEDGEGTIPTGLTDVFAIDAGTSFTLAIKNIQVNAAPAITGQPADQTVIAGASASFTVTATGVPAPTYQWRKGGADITGATSATYTIGATATADAGSYDVVVTNSEGNVTATAATLTVNEAPAIGTQPQTQTVTVGTSVTLTVAATGTPTPTYQWRKNGADITGATSTSLALGTVALTDTGSYDVVVTNVVGNVTSSAATITVQEAPAITGQPQTQTVLVGANVTFMVTTTGTPAPTYQWRKGGVNIDGATNASLQLNGVAADNTGSFDVVVTNSVSSVTSDAATLTVEFAPAFTVQPQSQTVNSAANVTLSATVTGEPTPTLQWRKDGQDIGGATSATLDLGTVSPGANGSYELVATNSRGNATSDAATVRVLFGPSINTQPASQTVNAGTGATFTVVASGDPAPTFQWQKDGTDINGATSAGYTITNTTASDTGAYTVVATNSVANVTSAVANLTVQTLPVINTQPQTQTVTVGTNVTLTVAATGAPAPTFQWRRNSNLITGATGTSLDLGTVALTDTGSYDAVVTNAVGDVTSAAATVTVQEAPAITGQPATQTVAAGAGVTFTVVATGTPAPTFQWQKDGAPITGATSASYTIASTATTDAGAYTVVVTNSISDVTSAAANLTVTLGAAITTQPVSQTITVGTDVTLTVVATGTPAPTYQWRKNGADITGATTASLALGNVALTDAGSYDVVVTNPTNAATSNAAVVTVQEAPAITTQPVSQVIHSATSAAFSVQATGTPAPTYQWRKDGADILGATSSSLGLSNAGIAEAGSYTVVVTNDAGNVTSNAATLTVVTVTGTQASDGYRLGASATVNNTVTYTGPLTKLVWSVVPPAAVSGTKWILASTGGIAADISPAVGTTDLLEFTWNTVPTSPFTFSYSLTTPTGTTGTHTLATMFAATSSVGTLDGMVTPDPLGLSKAAETHTADTDRNLQIDLSELLRVITLYNTRTGTTRTGRHKVDVSTTDGFAPDTSAGTTQASFHAADSNEDSQIDLSELLRVIALYNTRSGTERTGEYHVDTSTTDGFATGPDPATTE